MFSRGPNFRRGGGDIWPGGPKFGGAKFPGTPGFHNALMQAGIFTYKMYESSDFKYCLFRAINTAYRVFMRVYNGLLPTADMASPKYN